MYSKSIKFSNCTDVCFSLSAKFLYICLASSMLSIDWTMLVSFSILQKSDSDKNPLVSWILSKVSIGSFPLYDEQEYFVNRSLAGRRYFFHIVSSKFWSSSISSCTRSHCSLRSLFEFLSLFFRCISRNEGRAETCRHQLRSKSSWTEGIRKPIASPRASSKVHCCWKKQTIDWWNNS